MSPSSRGLGHRPFTAVTGVRIPLGMPTARILKHASGVFFLACIPAKKAFKGGETAHLLQDLQTRIAALADVNAETLHDAIAASVEANGVGFGKVGQPARLAVTGGAPSPDLAVTLSLLNQAEILRRLQFAAEYIAQNQG